MSIKSVKATINGTIYNLVLNPSTGYYEAEITAPTTTSWNVNDGHYYPISVTAENSAGTTTTVDDQTSSIGSSLRLFVKEKTKPVISITNPSDGQRTTNNKPTIQFTVTDADSGVNPDTIKITVNNRVGTTSGITKTPITNGYSCSYVVPYTLDDGNNTVKVDATDNDGNTAQQKSVTFVVDTVPPQLSVVSPINNFVTNKNKCTLSGTTNDITSSPVVVVYTINGGSQEELIVSSSGSFSKEITLFEGENVIVVKATDASGQESTVTRIVTYDSSAPQISDVIIKPNPVGTGEIIKIQVRVTG